MYLPRGLRVFVMLLFTLFIHLAFLLCSFYSRILLQNCVVRFTSGLLICPRAFSTDLLVGFSFFILEYVLFILLDSVSVSF